MGDQNALTFSLLIKLKTTTMQLVPDNILNL